MKGWLDNFGKADNANESNVSLPEDFNGLAYDTTGRNYSPAWGGQFQQGGTLPGSAGFMYARTIDPAPSNGKYAKKTKASAQNGKEMQFYQNGLDWKPKSMQDGGVERISTSDPRYPELYKNRQVGAYYDGAYTLPDLPEFTVSGKDESLKEAMYQGSNRFLRDALGVLGSSQTVPMELITGKKQQTPSEAWGFDTTNNPWYHPKSISNFAMDAVIDPMNLIGAGVADDLLRLGIKSRIKNIPSNIKSNLEKYSSESTYPLIKFSPLNSDYRSAENISDYLKGLTLAGIDELPKSVIKSKPFKYLAYKAGSNFSGAPTLSTKSLNYKNIIKGENTYDGSWDYDYDLDYDNGPSNFYKNRNLVNLYINQIENGFEPSNLEVIGLDKYFKKYGDIKTYKAKMFDENMIYTDADIYDLLPDKYIDKGDVEFSSNTLASKRKALKKIFNTNSNLINFPTYRNPHISDNIAGHQSFIRMIDGKPYLQSQDIWKFDPDEYSKKWIGDKNLNFDNYIRYKQASLMDKVGKPFILNTIRPINSKVFKAPSSVHLQNYINKLNKPATFTIEDLINNSTNEEIKTKFLINSKQKSMRDGGIIKDNQGYWNPDNWGKPVEIESNNITMQGVYEPLLGISDTGDVQYMTPGNDYKFKGSKVTEFPVAKLGINDLDAQPMKKLNQLLNFTNNPDKTNWLDKYQ